MRGKKLFLSNLYIERNKLILGATQDDQKIFLKIGASLKVVTDSDIIASNSNMTIAVMHCDSF